MAAPQHASHRRGVGHPDVEGIAAAHRAAAGLGHPDHPTRHFAEQQEASDRIFARGKKPFSRVGIDHDQLFHAAHGRVVEQSALGDVRALDPEVLRADAVDLRGRFLVAVAQGRVRSDGGRGAVDVGQRRQALRVRGQQGAHAAGAAVAEILAGIDVDGVGAERTNAVEDAALGAAGQCHHAGHRGDADDDAEHGEKGPQLVRDHRQQRHLEGLGHAVE